ncbi:MAG: AMP-binding protein [Bacteriovoracaceae bacterium]|nr:AMP-binding protein [Bacteriovoracaceae bacterium]
MTFNLTKMNFHFFAPPQDNKLYPEWKNLNEEILKLSMQYEWNDNVALLSSGTTGQYLKGYIFSKAALLSNAKAVNDHLQLTSLDLWGISLPTFHISGASIEFRSALLGHRPIDLGTWSPKCWVKKIQEFQISITSLVPSQLYDLLFHEITPPPSLKKIILGGDFLSEALYQRSISRGWPILRSYGMTELGPQISTETSLGSGLIPINIHSLKIDQEGRLSIKSPSLFCFKFDWNPERQPALQIQPVQDFCDAEGFYVTQDLVGLENGRLQFKGRRDGVIKKSGRLFSILEMKEILEAYTIKHHLYGKLEFKLEDNSLILFAEDHPQSHFDQIQQDISELIYPHKIDQFFITHQINRNHMGKVKWKN